MKRVLIVAGDPSGDLIASQLVEAMKKREPSIHVDGLGGAQLEARGRRGRQFVEEHKNASIQTGKIYQMLEQQVSR